MSALCRALYLVCASGEAQQREPAPDQAYYCDT
jgi:hypothetical protein